MWFNQVTQKLHLQFFTCAIQLTEEQSM